MERTETNASIDNGINGELRFKQDGVYTMRTSERSYLQAIGNMDADRASPLHDHVCLYLAQAAKRAKLVELVLADGDDMSSDYQTQPRPRPLTVHAQYAYDGLWREARDAIGQAFPNVGGLEQMEYSSAVAVTDIGEWRLGTRYAVSQLHLDKYKRPVASFDLVVTAKKTRDYKLTTRYVGQKYAYLRKEGDVPCEVTSGPWERKERTRAMDVIVEVKSTPQPIGQVIQQLEFYRRITESPVVLAVTYPLRPVDRAALKNQGFPTVFVRPSDVSEFIDANAPTQDAAF